MKTSRTILAICLAAAPAARAAAPGSVYEKRGDAATSALVSHFWSPGTGHFALASNWGKRTEADYWLSAEALETLLDRYELSRRKDDAQRVDKFVTAKIAAGGFIQPRGKKFYDDENWMALALVHAYTLTGQARYLTVAQALYRDVASGEDPAGGIWWDDRHTQKATASNVGPVILGVRLYQATGDGKYLKFARRTYGFWLEHMTTRPEPDQLRVYDHLNADGTIDKGVMTYDAGLMTGAAVALYGAIHVRAYLEQARALAKFVMLRSSSDSDYGRVLSNRLPQGEAGQGEITPVWRDFPQFKGIAFRNLVDLYRADPDPALFAFLKSNADAVWNLARDRNTGLFSPTWHQSAASVKAATLSQQSAAASTLIIFAQLVSRDGQWKN